MLLAAIKRRTYNARLANALAILVVCSACGGHAESEVELHVPPAERERLAAGAFHNCALLEDGSAQCWILGEIDKEDDHGQAEAPSGAFIDLSVSTSHSCALRTSGEAVCWGRNETEYYGQADPPPGQFEKLAAGERVTCALDAGGRIVCWGLNQPSAFEPLSGTFVQVAVEASDVCGLNERGDIHCTGPLVAPGGPFTAATMGANHACGLRQDGSAECWGDNADGQLDVPTALDSQGERPVAFRRIDASADHTCGVSLVGGLWCWGFNGYGGSPPPTQDVLVRSVGYVTVGTGRWHHCAEREKGGIVCWGFGSEESVPPNLR